MQWYAVNTLPHLMQALALQAASCNGKVHKGDSGTQVRWEGNLDTNGRQMSLLVRTVHAAVACSTVRPNAIFLHLGFELIGRC